MVAIKWHRQLGECYYNLGELSNALDHLETALEKMKQPLPEPIVINDSTLPQLTENSILDTYSGILIVLNPDFN